MNLVDGIEAFVKIADLGSFAAAARELNISPSAVSKLVGKTEEELGARLLNRNTRGLSLTQEGEMFLERCRMILNELKSAKEELSSISSEPRGKLRVSMPNMPSFFVPLISRFIELYPAVMLEVALSDRLVDVVDEGFDAVIRVGQLSDSRLTARSLGNCPMNLVASPEYLKRYGTPSCVDDLGSHSCIQYRYPSSGRTEPWPLLNAGAGDINIIPAVVCNNTDVRLGLALNGKGIVFMPRLLTEKYLASGELEIVLGDIVGRSYDMNIVWPTNRYTTPRLKSFVSFMVEYFNLS
ncbi:LysR family transcriptional regulator [Salmonella enterica]|uniref:LysR family transcriptional regulator n=1 Tax=Salmonella enterica subsp. salamae serovar 50:b:z6 TaxID=1967621 RepID=A0A603B6Q6_SALER|nr:LysR family transcriptional regulator [Salmonella enterica]EAB9860616.1 LysR family transcriptional regulator [Salmonella enterica subsp. salamae]EAP7918290.1 LysR family transcriptional regulator [Salmonella enterica]EBQ4853329.1 LysR family transcriptional regulator [Salmonella enterica subsp. salamae]ECC1645954.1 LysR family transcriptional regulator [Salmonella enterica subsp. salamae]ECD9429203.1 LysR family transcriptional regulator [Salmonella enterica subsp. salamae]